MGDNDTGAFDAASGTADRLTWCREHRLLSVTLGHGDTDQAAYTVHLKGYERRR